MHHRRSDLNPSQSAGCGLSAHGCFIPARLSRYALSRSALSSRPKGSPQASSRTKKTKKTKKTNLTNQTNKTVSWFKLNHKREPLNVERRTLEPFYFFVIFLMQ
jgi:hypothetical protein